MRSFLVLATLFTQAACTQVLDIVDNQDIETSRLRLKPLTDARDTRLITIRGDRRLIRSTYTSDGQWAVCAETQADAIAARAAKANLNVAGKGTVDDSVSEALTTTYTRTELSDTVRQLSWHVCNTWMNGGFKDPDVRTAMSSLISGTMTTHQLRAGADVAALAKAKEEAAKANATLVRFQDCIKNAGQDLVQIGKCKS
jgi:hypothetical protein